MTLLDPSRDKETVKRFFSGDFKVKSLANAEMIADYILQVKPYYEGYKRRSFVFAMVKLIKNKAFSFPEFLAKLKLQPTSLQDCPTVESYVALIEDIYNYRRREKINLRY